MRLKANKEVKRGILNQFICLNVLFLESEIYLSKQYRLKND